MPKLKDLVVYSKDATGETIEFTSVVNVSSAGEFSASLPDQPIELQEIAQTLRYESGVDVERTRGCVRVLAKNLLAIQQFLQKVADTYLKCDITVEDVILYEYLYHASYYKGDDGTIHVNGQGVEKDTGHWCGNLSGSTPAVPHYGVRFFARVMKKTTYTRPTGAKSVYSEPSLKDGSYGSRINLFIGLLPPFETTFHVHREERRFTEIAYSEEAAEFFYLTLIGICHLADRLTSFFSNKNNVQLAIEKRLKILAIPEASKTSC